MSPYIISPAAARDIHSILAWTGEHYGEQARLRYAALVAQAITEIARDPARRGSVSREEIAPAARTYHLWHARNGVPASRGRVRHPRHFLLFRSRDDGRVEIARVLHDSMDLQRQLPREYRAESGDDPPSA
jgi:toxin ParE1/3/4